jgi:SAM-dependent methyltransferase
MAWLAQGQSSPDSIQELNAFLGWASTLSPDTFPDDGGALLNAYRTKLIRDGISSSDADQLITRLRKSVATDSRISTLFYNKHYARRNPIYSSAPNAFLVETVQDLRPGRALDVGMGDGRNAIFMAQRGWDVTGIDLAEVGVARAKKRAADLRIKLNALIQDADGFDFGIQQWDLVCLLYFSGYPYVHDIQKRIANGLKPGGYIIGEGPDTDPKDLTDGLELWTQLGITVVRLEYRAKKADWGQPGFSRMLLRKSSA